MGYKRGTPIPTFQPLSRAGKILVNTSVRLRLQAQIAGLPASKFGPGTTNRIARAALLRVRSGFRPHCEEEAGVAVQLSRRYCCRPLKDTIPPYRYSFAPGELRSTY